MRALFFKNPVYQPGLNVTVRNGAKWANVVAGEELAILETDTEYVLESATVIGADEFEVVSEIPDSILRFEHDSSCRTQEGLIAAMDVAYGQDNWGADGITVLAYWV